MTQGDERRFQTILSMLRDLESRMESSNSPWLSAREASKYLRCSVRKINALTKAGHLPYHRLDSANSRSVRLYHRKHLAAYLVSGHNPVTHRLTPQEKEMVEDLCE